MGGSTFSTFWAGRWGPYQHLCLASWIAHGFKAVVYTSEASLDLPKEIEKRSAEEILYLGGYIHRYKSGHGTGSPSLHSNLFRYLLLQRGEWWLDTDIVVLGDTIPAHEIFLARQANGNVGSAVMHFPAESMVMREAVNEALHVIDKATWSQIGPRLVTRLVKKHGLEDKVAKRDTAYAIDYDEVIMFFDPAAKEEVDERVASSTFVHLWNEIWNSIGFPQELGPPEGSYLDALFRKYIGTNVFEARMPITSIETWWQNRERRIELERELAKARAKIDAREA
jgi:hypothetical protein